MKKYYFIIFIILLFLPLITKGAVLYLEPSSGQYQPGDTFGIEIKVDTEKECINVIEGNIKFSPDILKAVDFSQGKSIISFWIKQPEINQELGLISFSGGIPNGYCGRIPGDPGASNLLGKIIFRIPGTMAKEPEENLAEVKFLDSSQVFLNDGKGTKANLVVQGASFEILNQSESVKDEWQEEIKKDNILPESFEIEISQNPAVFEGKYFITFSATDKQTGIDHYEIKEGKKDWNTAASPYVLENQRLTDDIRVKAVDKAGNERAELLRASHKSTKYSYILYLALVLILIFIILKVVRRFIKHKMKNLLIFFIVLIIFAWVNLPISKAQESASIYLSPGSGTFQVGSTFDVSLFVNTGGNDINAVEVNLKFDPTKVQVASPTAGKSFISVWISQPTYSNVKGTLSFQGGMPSPGINTSSGLISTVTFRAIAPGDLAISVLESSKVLLNDGKGTDILTSMGRAVYNLILPPPEGPKVFSVTHPDQNKWYKNNSPTLNWGREEGVTDFSYTIDNDFQGVPDNVSEGKNNSAFYADLGDGIWYFHIKAKKGDIWGGISHYILKIDSTPPAAFTLNFEPSPAQVIFTQQPIISFVTTDALSGIDHYELKTINLNKDKDKAGETEFFVEANSPYRLSLDSGPYKVIARAYDKAGNWQDSSEALRIIPRGKFVITRGGINFWFIFLSWWLIILLLGCLIAAISVFIFLSRRHHFRLHQERAKLEEIKKKSESHKNKIKKRINSAENE